MKIEVGKAYKTRSGKLAIITIESENGAIGGYIMYSPADRRRHYWMASGRNSNIGRKLATDIVADSDFVPTNADINYFRHWIK